MLLFESYWATLSLHVSHIWSNGSLWSFCCMFNTCIFNNNFCIISKGCQYHPFTTGNISLYCIQVSKYHIWSQDVHGFKELWGYHTQNIILFQYYTYYLLVFVISVRTTVISVCSLLTVKRHSKNESFHWWTIYCLVTNNTC